MHLRKWFKGEVKGCHFFKKHQPLRLPSPGLGHTLKVCLPLHSMLGAHVSESSRQYKSHCWRLHCRRECLPCPHESRWSKFFEEVELHYRFFKSNGFWEVQDQNDSDLNLSHAIKQGGEGALHFEMGVASFVFWVRRKLGSLSSRHDVCIQVSFPRDDRIESGETSIWDSVVFTSKLDVQITAKSSRKCHGCCLHSWSLAVTQ